MSKAERARLKQPCDRSTPKTEAKPKGKGGKGNGRAKSEENGKKPATADESRKVKLPWFYCKAFLENRTRPGKDDGTCLKPRISGAQLDDMKQVYGSKFEQLAAQLKATK